MSAAVGIVESLPDAVRALRAGDRRVLSRMLSSIEDGDALSQQLMTAVRESVEGARPPVLALTGPPGVGKSTLAAALAAAAVEDGHHVAVLAVDPSSPITGGAVLGDRVRMAGRMSEHVYFRSFANRGLVGGVARVIPHAVELVSAAGYSLVVIETVGVGQSEIDVRRHADLTVVVLAPQMGDEIQAAKAGLLEIADVVVVNKCDLPDAGRAVSQMRASVRMRHTDTREAVVLKAAAATGENVAETWTCLWSLLAESAQRDRERTDAGAMRGRLDEVASAMSELIRTAGEEGSFTSTSLVGQVIEGRIEIDQAVAQIEQLLTRDPVV